MAIAVFASAFVPVAFADEKPSALQTALSNTTISGGVEASILTANDPLAASGFSPSFSPSPIPEPSSLGLLAVGTAGLVFLATAKRRWYK